ncbi:hypothetical protein NP233_g3752 [Leucocoprinus birnbaumii]|uniref:Uncharacterized protein n=1 Tax=Leucocoprinus birnbaumii TaxID=56174 RepID=A0AAD5VWM8_9AGAR|nr:hypothetical protein NP233_g3752 [Leucocoprinus birnbaumii]
MSLPITDILIAATEVRTTISITLKTDCDLFVKGWRIWVIWTASPYALYVVALYFVFYLARVGVLVAGIIIYLHGFGKNSTRKSNLDKLAAVDIAISAIQTAQQLIAFCLICGRIVLIRWRATRLMTSQSSTQFTGIVAMLTESYALSTILSASTIITTPAISKKSGSPAELILKMINHYIEPRLLLTIFSSTEYFPGEPGIGILNKS